MARRKLRRLLFLAVACSWIYFIGARAAAPPSATVAQVWETALGSDQRLSRLPDLRLSAGPAPGNATALLLLEPSQAQQRIVGFGGAFTEATAVALASASPLLQQQVLEAYFGKDGLGYSLCRVHMGSCDYCEASYSEDDTPGDWGLRHFNVSHDEGSLLPLIRRALATRASWHGEPFALLASPWSPPAWLKTNRKMSGKPWKKHRLSGATLRPDSGGHSPAATWALYFSKFIDAYAERGVSIEYVTAQNEPTNFPCAWEACHFTSATQAQFIAEHLGPTLAKNHPQVKLLALDDNKDLLERWMGTVYSSAAEKFVAGAGLHWYTGDHFDAVAKLSAAHPCKLLLGTEACAGPGAAATDSFGWARAESYAHDILGDLSAGAHGWIDWNMALRVENCTAAGQPQCVSDSGKHVGPCCTTGPNHVDPIGDDAPVIVDSVLGTVRRQPMFYYMGHFSKFLPPGSTRVSAELNITAPTQTCGGGAFGGSSSSCVTAVGFVAGGTLGASSDSAVSVAVLLNRGSTAVDVSVQVGSGDGASWLQVWLPARAIQTLRMKGDDATATSAESASITDEMGKRQHLLMQAYSRAALAKGQPPPCSQAEVYSFMFILSAGNTTEKALVLAALAALPTRCPGFLLPMESGFAASSSCALMRVNKLAANAAPAAQGEALPLASKLVIGRVLLNMSADPLRGSLWSFVTRRADDTIEIDDSENLDLANKIPVSLALELIAELPAPEFGPQLRLPDGHTVAEHCEAWACYWRTFFRTRALYGINVETSSTSYSKYFIEELACMHDLTLSQSLRALISDYMQVYFADAATEYISSLAVRGGAKSRCYHDYYSLNDGDPLGEVGWLLGWTGNATSPAYASDSYGNYYIHLAATSWRPLAQLAHIAHTNSDKALTKPFTYASHRLGRAADVGGDGSRPGICHRDGGQRGAMVAGICYFLNITEPSLLRQTYVAPEFMLGTLTFDPLCNYTAISSQNNVMGAVFSGSTADRLVFGGTGSIVSGRHGSYPLGTEFLSLSAVQVGPAAVLQRPLHASASNGSYTFISGALPHRGRPPWPGEGLLPSLRKTVEEWWCFHDTNGWTNNTRDSNASFGCVRFPGNEGSGTTNFTIDSHDAADSRGGILLLPVANMWAPTLVQLGRAADFDSFHSFVDSVRKLPVSWDPSSGHLKMTTLNGSTIETWAQSKRLPVVDGVPIHPPGVGFSGPVYGGPFLRGGGAVGVVEIAHPATGAVSLDFKSNVTRVGAVGLKVDNTGLASRLAQKKTDDEDWSPLKGLPALPKPHHSWLSWAPLFLHTDGPSAAVTRDVVRITGSCSVYACFGDRHSCHRPSRPCQNDSAGQAAVEACVRLAGPHNGTIAINFSPWYCAYKGSDPTDISQQAKEEEAAELALWQTNLGKIKRWLKGRAAVSAILVDSEKFECNPHSTAPYHGVASGLHCSNETVIAAIDDKHNRVYDLSKKVFPHASVEFFGRGEQAFHGPSSGGFVTKTMFSLREHGDSYGVSLYNIAELSYIREEYRRTVAVATQHGVESVTPYVSLGAGDLNSFKGRVGFVDSLEYPLLNSWFLGRDVNQLAPNYTIGNETSRHALGDFDHAKRVVLFPSVNVPACAAGKDTGCSKPIQNSTLALLHFSAYVLGANCIQMLPNRSTFTKAGWKWRGLEPGKRLSWSGCYGPP